LAVISLISLWRGTIMMVSQAPCTYQVKIHLLIDHYPSQRE
jgi:hypothetical protein